VVTTQIQAQNLRNKYKNHPVIQPLIDHCKENKLSFEFLKESIPSRSGIKSFNETNIYYMKIGNNLLKQEAEICGWQDLLELISHAYDYLDVKKPEKLLKAVDSFKKKSN
jgi:hypothetical protein